MASGASRQGATDLATLRAVFGHQPGAWAAFVRQCQADVYTACRLAFPVAEANDMYVQVMDQLRADDFALLRAFDGRATLSAYLRLVLREVLSQRVARLLVDAPERGWRTFEHFFRRDIERIITRYFPTAADGGRDEDIYHDIISALIENGYRRILAYDGQGSFGGFVLRIVNNLCVDLLRKDVPRRRLPAAIQRLTGVEQEVFRQLHWEGCAPENLASALRSKSVTVDGPETIAAAIAAVRAALPRNFTAADERPRLVALPTAEGPGAGDLPDERPTPEDATIRLEDEATLEQASGALRSAIRALPQEIRLYLQYVMSQVTEPPPRDIARAMARPVTEIYKLRQQSERLLRHALRDHVAIKNLRMSV